MKRQQNSAAVIKRQRVWKIYDPLTDAIDPNKTFQTSYLAQPIHYAESRKMFQIYV